MKRILAIAAILFGGYLIITTFIGAYTYVLKAPDLAEGGYMQTLLPTPRELITNGGIGVVLIVAGFILMITKGGR